MNKKNNSSVRLRIAPSPTGYPHIGTIYQALFNYAYAKKHNGKFLVRIEDTDRSRFVSGAEEVIFNSLDWFGLPEDESPRKNGKYGPYRQSERLGTYHTYAQKLLDIGKAYFAYLPRDQAGRKKDYTNKEKSGSTIATISEEPPTTIAEMLSRSEKNWVVRMRVPKDMIILFKDEIRGEIKFESQQVTEQILIKSDGFPTYHLAVVVDDYLMGITHVVRAEEWISSTPKHVLLYQYFAWKVPLIYHTATLRNPDKSKLSKRHGHTNVTWYREEGYLPEAILNFLALLGWTHPKEKEIFSLEEFINLFDLKDIRPVAPIFDLTKLTWMNQQYIQMLSPENLKKRLKIFNPKWADIDDKLFDQLIPLVHVRMTTLKDFEELTRHFFINPKNTPRNNVEQQVKEELYTLLKTVNPWEKDEIFMVLKLIMTKYSIRMPVLYYLLTGSERGLPLPESLQILGKENVLARVSSNDL